MRKGRHAAAKLDGKKGIFLLCICIVLSSVFALFVIFQAIKEKPEIQDTPAPAPVYKNETPESEQNNTDDNNQITTEEITQSTRKKDTFTFLLAASDASSGNADSIMVICYDAANKTVGMVSIPRDTLIDPSANPAHFPKINSAYLFGIDALKTEVADLLGIPIDYYFTVKTEAFIKLVDTIGGIDFDVPVHMSYDDPLQNLSIHFEPGIQHLDGKKALGVCRLRQNQDGTAAYPDYDIGRTRTQQAMLKAIAQKVLTQPQNFDEYIRIFLEYCDTDLSFGNILWLAESAAGIDMETGIQTATLEGDGEVTCNEVKYCYQLYPDKTLEIINSVINPYVLERTLDDIHIFAAE